MLGYSYDASGNVVISRLENVLSPQITGQPVQQIAEPGEIVTFSVVTADAREVEFQWQFNGADIAGATRDSLLLTDVSAANEGQYSVVVTNSAGVVTSTPAALLLDSNRDGLPDSWEIANFGNLTSQRAEGDPDHDGVSNLDEFFDSTNPNSNTSFRPRLVAYGDAGGTVAVTPMKLSYDLGETVTLTATPSAPSAFVGWAGDLTGTDTPASLVMNGNKTVRARFASAVPLPPGLIASWRGETDASDLIGANNGTFFAGTSVVPPSITLSGKVGGAFNFDGTVHVRVADSPALRPAQITIETWVLPTVQSSTSQTIVARGSSTSANDTWFLGVVSGQAHFLTFPPNDIVGPSVIPLNQWTHLAASFDGTTKRLYVNGRQVSAGRISPLVYDPAAVPVTIGSNWAFNESSAGFTGRVDEVAIYNRALTPDEVWGIYNADLAGKTVTSPYFTSPTRLADVAPGTSYTQQLTTILGTGPVSFSLSAGALPPGMTLSSAGVVSGIPSSPGTFDFIALATDAHANATAQLCVLRVLQPVALPSDLVALWRAEPAAGNMAPDTIGGHDGGFFKGNAPADAAYTPDGKAGSAFAFDGVLYVQVPDATELRPPEMTAEAWVFPTLLSGNPQTVIASGSSVNNQFAWWMGVTNGTPQFSSRHFGSFGSGMVSLAAPFAIPLNDWTHLAISFDGTTKGLYVNGVQVASQGGLGALVYDSAAVPVTIGSSIVQGISAAFNGRVDEVSLYRRALLPDEIFRIADAGSAGKSTTGPYINSPSQLPFTIAGQAYSQTFTSIRGNGTVGYTLSPASTLPTGLTLTAAGVLSGVPSIGGVSSFVARATDATGLFCEQSCTLEVFESVVAPADLVGWWRAEGNAQDSAGANHGALRGGASFSPGEVGQAFSLNGTDGCVEISDAPTLRPVSLTLEAWVALDALFGTRAVFAKPLGTATSHSYVLWLQDGLLSGTVSDAAGIGPILRTTFTLAPGRWYHVAYTFDDGIKQQALYVDGVQVVTGANSKSVGHDAQSVFLGRGAANGQPNFFLQGRIDEAAIYDRALSVWEIAAIYNAGPTGKRL